MVAPSHSAAVSTGHDEPPGMNAFSFLPAADAAAHFFDHLHHREAQPQLVNARLVDMAGEAGQLGAAGFRHAQRREGRAAIAQDGRHGAEGLHVVQNRGALKRARPPPGNGGRMRGMPRLPSSDSSSADSSPHS